ncbi:MAG: GNAT family protein [Rhodanobacter sp.]
MRDLMPTWLEDEYVALAPLTLAHAPALEAAAADGELWNLRVASVPAPGQMLAYIEKALTGQHAGSMLPFAVREKRSGQIIGSSRYYEITDAPRRLAIGYTWYAKRWQRTHVNTASKRLLLQHAFSTIGCVAVTFHTDLCNLNSQRAIERLGALREGVLRAHKLRSDGSLRDTVCYSILAAEWAAVHERLQQAIARR